MIDLKELRLLARKATGGKWRLERDDNEDVDHIRSNEPTGCDEEDDTYYTIASFPKEYGGYSCAWASEANAEFIRAANPDTIIKLLDALDIAIESLEYCAGPTRDCKDMPARKALAKIEGMLK